MKKFTDILLESVKKMSDVKLDKELEGKEVMTFKYNDYNILEIGKSCDVFVAKEKEFFHIIKPVSSKTQKVIKELGLKEI